MKKYRKVKVKRTAVMERVWTPHMPAWTVREEKASFIKLLRLLLARCAAQIVSANLLKE